MSSAGFRKKGRIPAEVVPELSKDATRSLRTGRMAPGISIEGANRVVTPSIRLLLVGGYVL